MVKMPNQNGCQSAILNLTSSGISPLDSPYPKTPSSKQKRSLYLFWLVMSKNVENANKNGRQSAILNLTSWGISPLDTPYPKKPSSKQKTSLYLY